MCMRQLQCLRVGEKLMGIALTHSTLKYMYRNNLICCPCQGTYSNFSKAILV